MEDGDESIVDQPPPPPPIQKCLRRIDELATPDRRIFLNLYEQHAYHFPEDKVNRLKHLLQELYAMTPEEAARYFAKLRAIALRRKMKRRLRRELKKKHNEEIRDRVYKIFEKCLISLIKWTVQHNTPPIVSVRLRYMSDVILERLCNLRDVAIPSREKPDKFGLFLISLADWIAITVEQLHFIVKQKQKRK